jgi:hypothetical protein
LEEPPPQEAAKAARRIRAGALIDIRAQQNNTGFATTEAGVYTPASLRSRVLFFQQV